MDLYQKLGVARNADEATIKKAYRSLAKQLHPDKNKDNPKAADRFAEVTSAYDLLSDKDKRAQYDRGEIDEAGNPKSPFGYGGGGQGGPFRGARGGPAGFDFGGAGAGAGAAPGAGGGDFSDIFDSLFGAQRGTGPNPFGGGGGAGPRPRPARGADVAYRLAVPFEEAAALKSQRVTLASGKTVDLKITADAVNGSPMRLAGQGEAGPGGAGDGTVTVEVKPHRFFTRDADDVRLELPVRLDEAVLGASVKVPTPDGAVMLKVPPGSTSGKVFRVPARGFHRKDGRRGDLLVTLAVDLPPADAALKAFVESWDSDRSRNPRAGLGV